MAPASDGALYQPNPSKWMAIAPSPLFRRSSPRALSAQDQVLVVGGVDAITGAPLLDGAYYDIPTDTWIVVPPLPFDPSVARLLQVVAVGRHVVALAAGDRLQAAMLEAGGNWTVLQAPQVPIEVDLATAVATDREIVWILYPSDRAGALAIAFNPASAEFRRLPDPPLSAGAGTPAIWTGHEVITLGGSADAPADASEPPLAAAVAFDPGQNRWRQLTGTADCTSMNAVWAGTQVISIEPPRSYDPTRGICRVLPPLPPRPDGTQRRESVKPVWTGDAIVVYSGHSGELPGRVEADGLIFVP